MAFRPLAEFVHEETTGGALLLTATVVALIVANVAPVAYDGFWSTRIGSSSPLHLDLTLRSWVNDALMTVFFFVVGLEIKRELVVGELATPRAAALPTIAAAGGMALPAGIYALVNSGAPARRDEPSPWRQTSHSFSGPEPPREPGTGRAASVPAAVAIVDDIGAILVIAVFYGEGLSLAPLLAALVVVGAVIVMRRRVLAPAAYVPFAVALWLLVHESGIHATIAGVALLGTSQLGEAKLAILATSLVAAVTGSWLIARTKTRIDRARGTGLGLTTTSFHVPLE